MNESEVRSQLQKLIPSISNSGDKLKYKLGSVTREIPLLVSIPKSKKVNAFF